jgi:hypothetical protein
MTHCASQFALVEIVRANAQLLFWNWRTGLTQESKSEFRMQNRIIIEAIDTAATSEIIPMLEENVFPFVMTEDLCAR